MFVNLNKHIYNRIIKERLRKARDMSTDDEEEEACSNSSESQYFEHILNTNEILYM